MDKPSGFKNEPSATRLPNREDILVCFAVKEEAGPRVRESGCTVLLTGMGRRNAVESLRKELSARSYKLVLTCGFAGGLDPNLPTGAVLYSDDINPKLAFELDQLGAKAGKFHCAKRVAITSREKSELWKSTQADAVEMESSVIRNICSEQGIPSATVRVILDPANEDLPLDFNALMTSHDRINYPKLIWTILISPHRILPLCNFWRQSAAAAKSLDEVLAKLLLRIS